MEDRSLPLKVIERSGGGYPPSEMHDIEVGLCSTVVISVGAGRKRSGM